MWLLTLIIANLILVPTWYIIRKYDYSNGMLLLISALSVVANLFYWHSFRTAPSFVTVRYMMSAMTHTMSWVMILLIFKEPISVQQVVGVGMIVGGGFLVR